MECDQKQWTISIIITHLCTCNLHQLFRRNRALNGNRAMLPSRLKSLAKQIGYTQEGGSNFKFVAQLYSWAWTVWCLRIINKPWANTSTKCQTPKVGQRPSISNSEHHNVTWFEQQWSCLNVVGCCFFEHKKYILNIYWSKCYKMNIKMLLNECNSNWWIVTKTWLQSTGKGYRVMDIWDYGTSCIKGRVQIQFFFP